MAARQPLSVHPLVDDFIAHQPQLRRAACRWMGDPHLADDVVQEACMKLMQGPAPPGVLQPAAYCMRVVRHMCIDNLRRRRAEQNVFIDEAAGADVEAPGGTPEHVAIGREHLCRVQQRLRGLPTRTRQAFLLHRVDGHTQQAVAERLGVSVTLVNFMLRDAMSALASCRELLRPD